MLFFQKIFIFSLYFANSIKRALNKKSNFHKITQYLDNCIIIYN